jgi:hypothetical protein
MRKTAFASSALSILAISLFLLAASMIIFYTLNKKIMFVVGAIFCFLPMVGIMFRQLSLPGAELIITGGLILFALCFIPWYAYISYRNSLK